jgi:hypothetical protein
MPSRPCIAFAGLPPLERFPALPWPLSRVLGKRAAGLQDMALGLAGHRGLRVVALPRQVDRRGFSRDGFHPAATACTQWAGWVVDGWSAAIEALDRRRS